MVVVTSLGPPEQGVKAQQEAVEVYINNRTLGMGTLYVSESRVSWVGITERGFSLEYPHIAVHAVCRDLTQFHSECLYLMIDVRLMDSVHNTPSSSSAGSDMEDNEENDSEGGMTEIRFIPDDKSKLDSLFQAMNECASLHPDEDASEEEQEEEEEGEEEGMYDDAEEEAEPRQQNGAQEDAMDAD